MRPIRISAAAALANLNLIPRQPPPSVGATYVLPLDLPVGQKIALLTVRGGAIANAIAAHLREMSAPEPEAADWEALVAAGRVTGHEGARRITPSGLWAAGGILRDYARKFGIHAVSLSTVSRPRATCSCGWSAADHATRNGTGNVQSAAHWHAQETGGYVQ